jgi:lactam utilization protein B
MKPKRPLSPQAENAVTSIYQRIVERMEVLDQLHADYKVKQEEHFLKTFMGVLEKMGNDLIVAQEAYRNVDLEARKDDFCLLLAQELSFFKEQAYTLRDTLTTREKEMAQMKTEKQTVESELKFTRQGFEAKVR